MSRLTFPRSLVTPKTERVAAGVMGAFSDKTSRRRSLLAENLPRIRRLTVAHLVAMGIVTVIAVSLLVRTVDFAQVRTNALQLFRQPALLVVFLLSYSAAFWLRA